MSVLLPFYHDIGQKASWVKDAADERDADVIVYQDTSSLAGSSFSAAVEEAQKLDASVNKSLVFIANSSSHGGRLILSPTGVIDADYEDVRAVVEAAKKGLARAQAAGAKQPVLHITEDLLAKFPAATEAALAHSLLQFHVPIQGRESGIAANDFPKIHFAARAEDSAHTDKIAKFLGSLETARRLTRDIGGSDPERMSPPRAAQFIQDTFSTTAVKVSVLDDVATIAAEYPLLHAVSRAALHVPRHHPRVVRLEYRGDGAIEHTLFFAGKGVTYDTGGADLKIRGAMRHMSTDKYGAAAVAGFFKVLADLKPKGVYAYAELGFVRNSIGSDAYVSDEVIKSHAGVRVEIGNTDAEGRLVLADLLSHLREHSSKVQDKGVAMFSVATLTGHAALAVGGYTIAVENGPAKKNSVGPKLQCAGDKYGEPVEISSLRPDDFKFIQSKGKSSDIISCNTAPSSRTKRGHQFPVAFLVTASGLKSHGTASARPIPYTHLDIAGALEQEDPAPLVSLAYTYVVPQL